MLTPARWFRARRQRHRRAQRHREYAALALEARGLIVRALGVSQDPWVLEHLLVAVDEIDAALATWAPNDKLPDLVAVPAP